jgi:inositol transport system substrate-binding protein
MIEQGYKAIMVVPVDTSAMGPITEAVTKAGIPLIYVNRNPFGTEQPPTGVYYVGSQEIVAGQLQGEYLVKLLGDNAKGGVGILEGILSNEGAVKRTEGNETVLSKYPDIKILAKEAGDWQSDKGMSITENWLTAYGKDLTCILANNDGMAMGALQALEAAGRDDVIVMGVDAIPDAVKLVNDGKLTATVLQDAKGQGGTGVDVADKAIKGETPEAITWIDFVLIDKDNVAQYL